MAHKTHAQLAKAATRVLPEEDPEFQIAPMIDILLVLLVFFMSIATEQVLQVRREIILPVAKEAKQPDASEKKKSELMLNLTWSDIGNTGSIIVDDKTIDVGVLADLIRRKKEINPDLRVIIRADKSAKYAYVRSIMVAMGAAGVPNVTFSAVDKEMQPQ